VIVDRVASTMYDILLGQIPVAFVYRFMLLNHELDVCT